MGKRHILMTTDFSDESLRAVEPVAELARDLGARVTLLFALTEVASMPHGYPFVPPVPVPELSQQIARAKTELEKFVSRFGDVEVSVDATTGSRIDQAICDYAKEKGVDLIAMSTHGRSGVRRMFLGSVAESVLRTSEIPVIVYPN